MSKLLFVNHGDDIEAGYEYKKDNGTPFFSAKFIIKPEDRRVRTDCGDPYMNFSVSFDEFLEIANKIKEIDNNLDQSELVLKVEFKDKSEVKNVMEELKEYWEDVIKQIERGEDEQH